MKGEHDWRGKKLGFYANGEYIVSKTEKYMDDIIQVPGGNRKSSCCTEEEVESAISARQAYPGWSSTPVMKRVQILYRLRDLLVEHMDELTYLVAYENGRPGRRPGDVLKAKEATEQAISAAPSMMMGRA